MEISKTPSPAIARAILRFTSYRDIPTYKTPSAHSRTPMHGPKRYCECFKKDSASNDTHDTRTKKRQVRAGQASNLPPSVLRRNPGGAGMGLVAASLPALPTATSPLPLRHYGRRVNPRDVDAENQLIGVYKGSVTEAGGGGGEGHCVADGGGEVREAGDAWQLSTGAGTT